MSSDGSWRLKPAVTERFDDKLDGRIVAQKLEEKGAFPGGFAHSQSESEVRVAMWQNRIVLATVDLPEELLKRAESAAAARGVSLGDLIGDALTRDLGQGSAPAQRRHRLRFPLFTSKAPGSLLLTNADVARSEVEADERWHGLPR